MSESIPSPAEQKKTAPVAVPSGESPAPAAETDGRESGLDPTRYGDWEKNGRCIDF